MTTAEEVEVARSGEGLFYIVKRGKRWGFGGRGAFSFREFPARFTRKQAERIAKTWAGMWL